MTAWIWSRRSLVEGGGVTGLARDRGPATAAFLRGVPGALTASARLAVVLAVVAGRRDGGLMTGSCGGFLAMTAFLLALRGSKPVPTGAAR